MNPAFRDVDATPKLGEVLNSYGALDYRWHEAIAEFVDNSYDSFSRHSADLTGDWNIDLVHEARQGVLRIRDNAYGMSLEELTRAVKLAKENIHDDGIGKYGLGMKTAASWIGAHWTVKTKRKDETVEWTATVDIEALKAEGSNKIPFTSKMVTSNPESHYTIIEISKLRRKIPGRSIGKLKENLRFLYAPQLQLGKLNLRWGDEKLEYRQPEFLREITPDGEEFEWLHSFPEDLQVMGHTIKGRYGLLAGRDDVPYAGITLIWRNRVIVGGHRSAWQPEDTFGQGLGDLARQRVWAGDTSGLHDSKPTEEGLYLEEMNRDDLEEAIAPFLKPLASEARGMRRRGQQKPTEGQMKIADQHVKSALESNEIAVALQVSKKSGERKPIPLNEEVADAIEDASPEPLAVSINDGEPTVRIWRDPNEHSETAFMRTRNPSHDDIRLYLNTNHRFFSEFVGDDREKYELWQHVCIALALVEFNANRISGELEAGHYMVMLNDILKHIQRQE